ncbi:MAG TPA: D-aminoacylase [Burkholderiales bacterium]|nr:D-aminoacylase [Burkholderiales bacterium]
MRAPKIPSRSDGARARGWIAPCAIALLAAGASRALSGTPVFDTVIEHGRVIDGTGTPWFQADVGIRAGRIAAIGSLARMSAGRRIEARGLVVAPGFIDMLGQSELTLLVNPHVPSKLFQGITTEITGEGESVAPLDERGRASYAERLARYGIQPDWRRFADYFARLERQGIAINFASYVGATRLREMVVGFTDRPATDAELARMRALLRQAMEDGAMGLSSALEYPPAPYASTEELIALAREAAHFGGIYATHMRSYEEDIMPALDETFRIARQAPISVEIWHLEVAGPKMWGRMPEVVAKIEAARAAGLDVMSDLHAYTAWGNDMSAFVPPWAHDGGTTRLIERLKDPTIRARIRREMETKREGWDNEWLAVAGPADILVSSVGRAELRPLQGQSIEAIARARGREPIETLLDILVEDEAQTQVAAFGMQEQDVVVALRAPWVAICNDSAGTSPQGALGLEHPHPRAYGTFPRILRLYVRERHELSLEEAIRKFSALPAARLHLSDRGVLKVGLAADIVVFDAQEIADRATYAEPNQLSVGMRFVLVNGVPVIADGRETLRLPSRVLRGPGYRARR